MDAAFVVEVWVPATRTVGTGYLVSNRLVLTAYHVVQGNPPGAPVEFRPLGWRAPSKWQEGRWLVATVHWPSGPVDLDAHPEHDAALLLVADSDWLSTPPTRVARFGVVTSSDRLPCEGLGFPLSETRPDGVRDTFRVLGEVDPLHAFKASLLSLQVTGVVVPKPRGSMSGWAGASGMAVFCGPLLVGVLATDRSVAVDARVLGVVPVARLASLAGFRDTLTSHGVDLVLEPAPAPEHEQFLAPYLNAVGQSVRRQPYLGADELRGELPALASVYVRPRMRGPLGAVDALATDDLLSRPGITAILAGPGGGKSSLLRQWTEELAARGATERTELVPVLVRASALLAPTQATVPLADALAEAVNRELSPWLSRRLPADFFRAPPRYQAHWLVLVDGLDEVVDPRSRDAVLTLLEAHDRDRYRIVVATRPATPHELRPVGSDVTVYRLLPFTPADLRDVAHGWFRALKLEQPAASAEAFLGVIRRTKILDAARNPLLAAMLCQLFATHPDQPLPYGRSDLYQQFVDVQHEQRDASGLREQTDHRFSTHGPSAVSVAHRVLDALPQLMEELAAARWADPDTHAVGFVREQPVARRPDGVTQPVWQSFLDTTLRRSGLLMAQSDDLVFLHQTFLEHLAARSHASRSSRRRHQVLKRAFHNPIRYSPRYNTPGVSRRLWGQRYWFPPDSNGSYLGFLLDTALSVPDADGGARRYLARLASPDAGLLGCVFIAEQVKSGTLVPEDIVNAAITVLINFATDETKIKSQQDLAYRRQACEALSWLGDHRGADLLYQTAVRKTWAIWGGQGHASPERTRAAEMLAELGDPRSHDLLHDLAGDDTLYAWDRIGLAQALAKTGDPRGVDQLHRFATDRSLEDDVPFSLCLRAASALAKLGDRRGVGLVRRFAADNTEAEHVRREAASVLALLGLREELSKGLPFGSDTTVES
ncbi:hypothetical protein [Streptomyces sp. NPDC002156]